MVMMNLILVLVLCVIGRDLVRGEGCIPKDYGEGSIVCVCNATYCDTLTSASDIPDGQVFAYVSNKAGQRFERSILKFVPEAGSVDAQFSVDRSTVYQEMFGIGGAMTDAAGINIASLSQDAQDNLLRSFFSPEGVQLSLLRVPMGGADFSTHAYSYDDVENDVTLQNFNLTIEDLEYKLKAEYYQHWADYFVRFLDAYAAEGLQFWTVSPQNEPINGMIPNFSFNCMGWTAEKERDWIGNYLGPTLEKNGYGDLNLIFLDDQRVFLSSWPDVVLTNETVRQFLSGIGIHWYMDQYIPVSSLATFHENYPDFFLLYTEACMGVQEYGQISVILGSWDRAEVYANSIIETTTNWVSGWVDWNLALNEQGGPNWVENFVDAPVIVNATSDEFYKQPMYYALAHFSKFVSDGSHRIKLSTDDSKNVDNVAFETPEGKTVIIFLNSNEESVSVAVGDPEHGTVMVELSARSIVSLVY
ncbi:Glucosylceramidase [Blattella germanica]|nr:Glucosylceramidase [Blattella germanica]